MYKYYCFFFQASFHFALFPTFKTPDSAVRLCKCNYHTELVEEEILEQPIHIAAIFPGLCALPQSRINRTPEEERKQVSFRQLHELSIKLDS